MPHHRLGRLDQRVRRRRIGELRRLDPAARSERAGEGIERVAPRSRQCHRGALGVQRPGNRAADAAGGAGDERAFAGQIEHAVILFLVHHGGTEVTEKEGEKHEEELLAQSAKKVNFMPSW